MKKFFASSLLALVVTFALPAADITTPLNSHLEFGNFVLPFTRITNTAVLWASSSQLSAGQVLIPPNTMLVVGGRFATTNGTVITTGVVNFATSINGVDWLTNAFQSSNVTASASPYTNSWVTILSTNIPARYIAVDALVTSGSTALLVPYINYLFVPYLPNR